MTRRGTWIGATLRVVGLGVAAWGVWRGGGWALVAALGAALLALGLTVRSLIHLWQTSSPRVRPLDFADVLDLLRRAHGAVGAWAVGLRQGELSAAPGAVPEAVRRGVGIVRLASVDGRTRVEREESGTYVAAGDFPYGAGLLLARPGAPAAITQAAADDLRRLLAGMRLAEQELPEDPAEFVAKRLALAASGAQTLDGLARTAVELAEQLAQRGAVIAIQDPVARQVTVVAVSGAADKRLEGLVLASSAPVTRAVEQQVPLVTQGGEDIFGPGVPERRRRDRAGTAYPLLDGHMAVGALVLVGAPIAAESPVAEQIGRLVVELGPRLAAGRAVQDAERRATSDPLTGLCNRREFDRVIDQFRQETGRVAEAATLVYADLDHFKQLNDTLGHPAGDEALRHVAHVLQAQLRDGDVVARIGGEEFAVWLPRTPLREGLEIAERMRRAVEQSPWAWNHITRRITASCGVAAYPETVGDVNNLRSAADAALYRAKQAGRNRVEMAGGPR